MSNFVNMERISLKNNQNIKEDMIQKYIYENPSILGLGDLSGIQREKVQPAGGRLDLLMTDDENTRYEIEIQLGATDPSHIIRTIEYWDTEKKRYPQYDHCAVIIAEEITGRFMNVISLFNGTIPLIAIQIAAYKNGDDISLVFTKVDRVTLATDEDDITEITDRKYWENRSTPKMLKNVDFIFNDFGDLVSGYELKYNKFYIGVSKEGLVKNFVSFTPKKGYIYIRLKGNENQEFINKFEESGLELNYKAKWNEYTIRINNLEEYKKNRDLIINLLKYSMEYYNVD